MLKSLRNAYPLPLAIPGIPAMLFVIELFVRRHNITGWSGSDWTVYLSSIAVALLFWSLFYYFTRRMSQINRLLVLIPVFLVFLLEIAFLIVSYGYYAYFQQMPNYYTFEYILQEPIDVYAILISSVTWWHYTVLGIFTLGLSRLWILQITRNRQPVLPARSLLILLLLFAVSLYGFLSFAQTNRRPVLADLNAFTISSNFIYNFLVLKHEVVGSGLRKATRIEVPPVSQNVNANVLVILNESLRRQNLKAFGYGRDPSPFLTRFIAEHPDEVFVFNRAYANATITMLSVTSLLTGVNPVQPGTVLHRMPLLFDYGKALNYRTFFISAQSFAWRHLDQFFQTPTLDYFWNKEIGHAPRVHDIGTDDRFMLREWKKTMAAIDHAPFLGVMHTNATHYPYFTNGTPPGKLLERYDRSISFLDSLLADAFSYLDAENLLENTIIVFTSDHGEAFGEHGYSGHVRTYYEEESSIPFWIYIPKKLQPNYGEAIRQLRENTTRNISNIDLVPTAIDLLKLEALPETIRANFLGASLLRPLAAERPIFMLNNNEISNYKIFTSVGVVLGDYKYILLKDGPRFREALFNLANDPGEQHNLIADYPDKIAQIYDELSQYQSAYSILRQSGQAISFQDGVGR